MPDEAVPLVSCLCVTEGRPAFMPWLLWCFDRQQWPHRELVIVDSSPQPFQAGGSSDVRVVTAPPGTGVACKRNQALREARGDIITWFDDDDWQHPRKLELLMGALGQGTSCAGAQRSWFVDLMTRHCARHNGLKQGVIFNSAAFRRDAVMPIEFPESVRVASDTRWMQALANQARGRTVVLDREDLFFWLCHETNLSNPATRRHFTEPLETLKKAIGAEAWGDTDEALAALQRRLSGAIRSQSTVAEIRSAVAMADLRNDQLPAEPTLPLVQEMREHEDPAVGVMIKATVLDVPYLEPLVRHMIAQARYPFVERTIVVDRPRAFAGKYRDRPRATEDELNRILSRLQADGVIDHVREVDVAPQVVRGVMARYFGAEGPRVPTHAISGGPIYTTLYGLEAMSTDYVLQMDSDVFFYTGSVSWVRQALRCLRRDPRLWLMMTHPGPPAGPPGHSLTGSNAGRATWDPEMGIWRYATATTRYFLCDRRRLYQRLQAVQVPGGIAPLEQCISRTLQANGACRGSLGDLQSWHLHGWYHGEPFPAWAPALAQAIAGGQVPALQRGEYDLRLDRERDRLAWRRLLESLGRGESDTAPLPREYHKSSAVPVRASGQSSERTRPAPSEGDPASARMVPAAPLAVILPVRDRAGQRVRNTLSSLCWQTAGRPRRILVVSHGSQPQIDRELAQICQEAGATLLTIGAPSQAWSKPLALNAGIRAIAPDVPYLMTMDADMILAPNFVKVVLERLEREPTALVLCRSADLPQHVTVPSDHEQFLAAFQQLHRASQPRARSGTGGIQAAQRAFFFEIRGYDEDLVWWGAMDGDIVNRAQLLGMPVVWIDDQTVMLHQWHPRKQVGLADPGQIEQARQAWQRNHELVRARAQILQRNPQTWGGI